MENKNKIKMKLIILFVILLIIVNGIYLITLNIHPADLDTNDDETLVCVNLEDRRICKLGTVIIEGGSVVVENFG